MNSTNFEQTKNVLKIIDSFIGLTNVKREVHEMVSHLEIQKIRQERFNLKGIKRHHHLVFVGPPGTGKTSVARLLGEIYKNLGILEKGHFIEVSRSDLVGKHIGSATEETKKIIHEALGGVLFIDEAYSLTNDRANGDYGKEALEVLLKYMEDHKNNLIVIVAGYEKEMKEFIDSNPGLRSRFQKTIKFDNYQMEELIDIAKELLQDIDYFFSEDAQKRYVELLEEHINESGIKFSNARAIRNSIEHCIGLQSIRLLKEKPDFNFTNRMELMKLKKEDIGENIFDN